MHNLFREIGKEIGKAIQIALFHREVRIGDYVQWECNGAYQFPIAQKVLAIHSDESGKAWAFVEGTTTGLPVDQLIIEKSA